MKYILLLGSFSFISCSSLKTNFAGFEKVTYAGDEPDKVSFYFEKNINPSSFNSSRAIASQVKYVEESSERNKDIYFKNIWGQSKTIASFLKQEHVNSCPAFHQVIIRENVPAQKLSNLFSMKLNDPILFPFLALKKGNKTLASEERVESSLHSYLTEYYKDLLAEVKEICNTGVSENFFVFENTIRYFAGQDKKYDVNHLLNSYLKIPVFANLYLLDSLKNKTALLSNNERDILRKLDIQWFEGYLYKLRSKRENILSMR